MPKISNRVGKEFELFNQQFKNKKMKARTILLTFLALTFAMGCQKNLPEKPIPLFSEHDELDTSLTATVSEGFGEITTPSGVSVNGSGVLVCDHQTAFEALMNQIVNHNRTEISNWESSMSFQSRYSYWTQLQANDEYSDDSIYSWNRLADPYFESVVSPSNKISIGDTMYTYNFATGWVKRFRSGVVNDSVYIEAEPAYKTMVNYDCQQKKLWALADRKYNNNTERLKAYKWNRYYLVYASVGICSIYEKLNNNGKWKSFTTTQLTLFIDQWHHTTIYKGCAGFLVKDDTDLKHPVNNSDTNPWTLMWTSEYGIQYSVEFFQRYHCYRSDVMVDLHHESF